MKQIKLREPILYTSLWVVSVVIVVIWSVSWYKLNDTWIILLDIVLFMTLVLWFGWICIWRFMSLVKWSDRHETRDMKKYILWKIKDIDDSIEELKEEKEKLRKLIRQ